MKPCNVSIKLHSIFLINIIAHRTLTVLLLLILVRLQRIVPPFCIDIYTELWLRRWMLIRVTSVNCRYEGLLTKIASPVKNFLVMFQHTGNMAV